MTKGAAKHERVAAEKEAKKRTEVQAKQAKKINELDGEISELKAGAAKPTGKPGNNAPISDEERARHQLQGEKDKFMNQLKDQDALRDALKQDMIRRGWFTKADVDVFTGKIKKVPTPPLWEAFAINLQHEIQSSILGEARC